MGGFHDPMPLTDALPAPGGPGNARFVPRGGDLREFGRPTPKERHDGADSTGTYGNSGITEAKALPQRLGPLRIPQGAVR